MARITVEDCIDKFPSRFELVLVASNRARKLYSGDEPTVEKDNDKNTVIALREIADETITSEKLKEDLIEEYQTATLNDDEDLDEIQNQSSENIDESGLGSENNQINEDSAVKLPEDADIKQQEAVQPSDNDSKVDNSLE